MFVRGKVANKLFLGVDLVSDGVLVTVGLDLLSLAKRLGVDPPVLVCAGLALEGSGVLGAGTVVGGLATPLFFTLEDRLLNLSEILVAEGVDTPALVTPKLDGTLLMDVVELCKGL